MENKNFDTKLDKIIQASINITNKPSLELNNALKAKLYKKEAEMRREIPIHTLSLWYLPMVLNFITFILLSILSLLVITNPYLSIFIAGICLYISLAGIFITIVGVRRTNMKDDIIIRIQKRGVLS